MNLCFLDGLTSNKAVQALCWTLIHSIWEGLLLTLIAGLVLMLTKKSSSAMRYNIIAGLFFSFLAICFSTFLIEWNQNLNESTQSVHPNTINGIPILASAVQAFSNYFSENASLVVLIWFLVFSAKSVRMVGGLVLSHRIRNHKIYLPESKWINKLETFCQQLQIRKKVKLLESELVKIPVVIGHLKPMIFVPLGLLANLPAGQMEAVLLHELAHIRRNDYFINLLQNIAEAVFFFNPGLLWISSLLKEERENCCDDIALGVTKNKKQFIEALVSFKEYSLYSLTPAMAFPGKKEQLLHRVTRIIQDKNKSLNPTEKIFSLASLLALCILFATSGNIGLASKTNQDFSQVQQQNRRQDNELKPVASFQKNLPGEKSHEPSTEKQTHNKSHQPIVIEYSRKTITNTIPDQFEKENVDEMGEKKQDDQSGEQESIAAQQKRAEEDREQSLKDMQQAEIDREQADADRQQSKIDRAEAIKARQKAEMDRARANRDQQAAKLEWIKEQKNYSRKTESVNTVVNRN